jgi:phosphoribosylformylglycinamidine synthase I
VVKKPRVFVLKSAGTNCDVETKTAFELAGANAAIGFSDDLFKNKSEFRKTHIIVFPGGFSYGDDIAAGKVWATELKYFYFDRLQKFIERENLIIGICNGFQVLVKLGLLPAMHGKREQTASLICNDSGRYEDRWVYLKTRKSRSVIIRNVDKPIHIPVAHAEGKFITSNEKMLKQLFAEEQVVFQYVSAKGTLAGYPANPNGSLRNIAGICDSTGQVLGMMPHPERAILHTHYPNWRRSDHDAFLTGTTIINGALEYVRKTLL